MKTADDFKRAIGSADEAFSACVRRTVAQLIANEEEPGVKKLHTGLVVGFVLLLMSTIAIAAAAKWGVLDFLTERSGGGAPLPETAGFVETDIAQRGGHTDCATIALREAVYDGNAVYMVLEAKPTSDDILLIGPDAMPDDRMVNFGTQFTEQDGTLSDYAVAHNKSRLVWLSLGDRATQEGLDGVVDAVDYLLEEDGTLVFMVKGTVAEKAAELPISLVCVTTEQIEQTYQKQSASLDFTLTKTPDSERAASAQSAVFADCGVEVTQVALSRSPIATYVRIAFSVIDREAFAQKGDGLWFEFLDENDKRIEGGAIGMGSVEQVAEGEYVQTDSLAAMETLPDSVTLRAYNCWTKERYDTATIPLK